MTATQGEALRSLRGQTSLRRFAQLLADNGVGDGALSRQRLSAVERGAADLPASLWNTVADALVVAGRTETEVAALRPAESAPIIEPVPPSTPELRRRQWSSVALSLPKSRWWLNFGVLAERLGATERVRQYRRILEEFDFEPAAQLEEIRRRLALPPGGAHGGVRPGDALRLGGQVSDRTMVVGQGRVFVMHSTLHNVGSVAWRDRLLYRLGPPVTSSQPFALILLPVPDTDPGGSCEILVPGRAQWFFNRAVISYAMVSSDCTPCLPGRVDFFVDTRQPGQLDHTLRLPEGFRPSPGSDVED